MPDKRELAWHSLTIAAGALAALATRQLMTTTWRAVAGRQPPENPADRGTSWSESLIWAAAVGVGVGIARLVATRSAAAVWESAVHETPPGVQST